MKPTLMTNTSNLSLPSIGPVENPVGPVVSEWKLHSLYEGPCKHLQVGFWESSPGKWQHTFEHDEFCHFISGHVIYTPESGEPIEFRGGDAVFFPGNTAGVWDVRETVRKSYAIYDRSE